MISPLKYPALRSLLWNRNPEREISEEDVKAIYERNWKYIHVQSLTREEKDLILSLGVEVW